MLALSSASRPIAERVAAALFAGDARVARLPDGRWTLVPQAPGSPPLDACRFAVVDVETTGSRPAHGDRVMEVAVATLERGDVRLAFQAVVNPEAPVPPVVVALTGLADDVVRAAPRFAEVADALLAVLCGAVFAAHNVRFDWRFIAAELERTRALLLQGPRLCTMRLARRLLPDLPRRNLSALADYFGIAIERRHRAAPDALAAARILARLLGIARERGAVTLGDLMQLRIGNCGLRIGRPPAESAIRNPQSAIE